MGSMVSGLADAVLGVVESVGLSADTVARYRKCCGVVVKFCEQRGLDALSARVVDEFVACQQERARRGEIGESGTNRGRLRGLVLPVGGVVEVGVPALVVVGEGVVEYPGADLQ
jgi:hypothetical protein